MHQHEKFTGGTPRIPDPVLYVTNETRFQVDVLTRLQAALQDKAAHLSTTRSEAAEISQILLPQIQRALTPGMERVQSMAHRDLRITEYDRPELSRLAGELAEHPFVPDDFWSELQACANITYDVIPVQHYNLTPEDRAAGKPTMVPLFGAALKARSKQEAVEQGAKIHAQHEKHVTFRVELRKTVSV